MEKSQSTGIRSKIAILLAVILLFTTACGGGADTVSGSQNIESATADIMRLELFEGELKIKNSDGQDIEPFAGMRLQSGYTVETGSEGFAFISLDDSKAIKLDSASSSKIDYDGKDLLITLVSGSLFFNVTAPLADDESMNIQTSNMITGIRGTSGIVTTYEDDDRVVSETTIITGKVVVNAIGDDGDELDDVDLPAGNTAVYDYEDDEDRITILETDENSIPDFVLQVLADDDELFDEIFEDGVFDADELRDILDDLYEDNNDDDDNSDGDSEEDDEDENEEEEEEDENEEDEDNNSQSDNSSSSSSSRSNSDEEDEEDDDDDESSSSTPDSSKVEDEEEEEEDEIEDSSSSEQSPQDSSPQSLPAEKDDDDD